MKISFGNRIRELFSRKTFDDTFFEQLEDTLIEGDLGAKTALAISEEIQKELGRTKGLGLPELQAIAKKHLLSKIPTWQEVTLDEGTHLFLILGVNGVGKTTTIAKLASYYQGEGKRVIMAAGDTFRAAAIDQLALHAERLDCRIIKHEMGGDPGAVLFDAIDSALSRHDDLILADTAGRMHNKEHLLRELQKIDRIASSKLPATHYHKFLVIDATTGQNALSQAELFHQAITLDALILTKYDSAAKGGIVVQIGQKLNLPVAFVGYGEHYADLSRFNRDEFVDALVGVV